MSKVYDENDSREVVVSREYKITGVKCDICERIIPGYMYRDDKAIYFRVTTGHNDWGNDSCESIEHFDICPECAKKFVTEYLENCCDTKYIEIETEYAYPHYARI